MKPEDIKALIEQLLKTGEILATKAFELAVKQIYVYATLDVVYGLFFLVVGVLILRFGDKHNWDEDFFVPTGLILLIGGIFIALCSVRYFMNPEWYAVKLLLETFIK